MKIQNLSLHLLLTRPTTETITYDLRWSVGWLHCLKWSSLNIQRCISSCRSWWQR